MCSMLSWFVSIARFIKSDGYAIVENRFLSILFIFRAIARKEYVKFSKDSCECLHENLHRDNIPRYFFDFSPFIQFIFIAMSEESGNTRSKAHLEKENHFRYLVPCYAYHKHKNIITPNTIKSCSFSM